MSLSVTHYLMQGIVYNGSPNVGDLTPSLRMNITHTVIPIKKNRVSTLAKGTDPVHVATYSLLLIRRSRSSRR